MRSVKHSIEWLQDATNAAPEERATVCDLRLFLNDQNVTSHMAGERLGDHITIALYGLVDGIVHRWWSIWGARDREFSLRSFRTGYLFPDIRLQFDGAAFEISAYQCAYTNPDLRFWGGTHEVLNRQEGEAWLSGFVNEVLIRLEANGITDTSAALRWRRIVASQKVKSESIFCEAAGSLGLDPYQIGDGAAAFIEQAEEQFTAEALVEFVGGADNVDHDRLMSWVGRMMRTNSSRYRLADLRKIVDQVAVDAPDRRGEAAWAAGYRRARAMRRTLALRQEDRLTFRDLARRVGGSANYNVAPQVDGLNALRREEENEIHIHVRNHGSRADTNALNVFALARGIGDAVCFPAAQAASINRLRRAYRQSAGRAFAAELLAPIDEIRSMQEDEKDTYSIAHEFGVSHSVIEHQIENQNRIDMACL